MRRVALPGTELAVSALGFGCGGLMARMGRTESARCLEAAFEAGITHFDVARSYGYGEAESALGAFIAGRRDQVTVTTKLGIAPPRASRGLAAAKAVGRRVLALAPPLRRLAREGAAKLSSEGHFAVPEARASLETSLRELGTDHVDLLLLHECRRGDLEQDELLEFLRDCVREGKVRAFGTATDLDSTRWAIESAGEYAQAVQLASSAILPARELLGDVGERGLLVHSVLAGGLGAVHAHVTATDERRRAWSDEVGVDCADRGVLAALLLAEAAREGAGTVALFSSQSVENIRANGRRVDSRAADQVERFAGLVAREVRPAAVPG